MTDRTTPEDADRIINEIAAALGGRVILRLGEYGDFRLAGDILLPGSTDPKQDPSLYITFNTYRHEGKAHIRPNWPRDERDGTITPRQVLPYDERDNWTQDINCSATKSPAQIAKDIQRRLLPEYLDLHARCRAYIDASTAHRNSKRATRDRLAAILPESNDGAGWRSADTRDGVINWYGRNHVNVEAEVTTTTCYVTIRQLPVEIVELVFQVLADHLAK